MTALLRRGNRFASDSTFEGRGIRTQGPSGEESCFPRRRRGRRPIKVVSKGLFLLARDQRFESFSPSSESANHREKTASPPLIQEQRWVEPRRRRGAAR